MRALVIFVLLMFSFSVQAEMSADRAYKRDVRTCQSRSILVIQAVGVRDMQGSPQQVLETPFVSQMNDLSLKEKKRIINLVFFDQKFKVLNYSNVDAIMDQETAECIRSINAPKYQPLK